MKRVIIVCSSIILIFALLFSIGLGVIKIYADKNVNYELDEQLFAAAKSSNTVSYLAYGKQGKLTEVCKSSSGGRKTWVPIGEVSKYIKGGFISAEDREFYSHSGVNFRRTFGAIINYFIRVKPSFGASTITQQVVKNISGDNEYTLSRKFNEIMRALRLDATKSKDEIFEVYLNIVPMSGNICGVREASLVYFGKEPSELTLAESATIVGITNSPGKYNPFKYPDACKEKRNNILYAMLDTGNITDKEYEDAIKEELVLNQSVQSGSTSWFIETAEEEILADLREKYSITKKAATMLLYSGTQVILTMNPDVQNVLEEYFKNEHNLPEEVANGLEMGMVICDSKNGDLVGIIGGVGEKQGDKMLNHATELHAPGSTLKPLALYAPLIDRGEIMWSTTFEDVPTSYIEQNGESVPYPKNSPHVYEGWINISEAIRRSKNTVAVQLYDILGAESIYNNLVNDFGMETVYKDIKTTDGRTITDMAPSPLALGQLSYGISLRKLTESYTVFPTQGTLYSNRSYYGVFDSSGKVLIDKGKFAKRIFSEDSTQIMNMLLSGVIEDGTAKNIMLKNIVDTAGKTGTSGADRDRLFVGYTPYYTAGIWCGYSGKMQSIENISKSHLKVWDEVMTKVHEKSVLGFEENAESFRIDRVKKVLYCKESGEIAEYGCIDSETTDIGYFKIEEEPREYCKYHIYE